MAKMAGTYLLGGVTLVSEIALPELPQIQQQSAALHPVNIRLGEVPHHLPGAVELDPHCFATSAQYLLRIPGIASYLVSHGRDIVVSTEAGALPLDVRAYLLGSLFVVLCQQRGLLPLHASAVGGGQGVVAFLARSGQGKSSLAAHLARRGFPVVADDVCLIDVTPAGLTSTNKAMVIPAAPWLKLWRDSLQNLGRQAEGLERVFSEDDKYRLPLQSPLDPEPIGKLIFLESGDRPAPAIQELSPLEAIPLLMDLTHQAYVLQATGQVQENFRRCSRVSSQARAYRLIRPWGLQHLDSTVDILQKLIMEK
jgi:hypothetical protein